MTPALGSSAVLTNDICDRCGCEISGARLRLKPIVIHVRVAGADGHLQNETIELRFATFLSQITTEMVANCPSWDVAKTKKPDFPENLYPGTIRAVEASSRF